MNTKYNFEQYIRFVVIVFVFKFKTPDSLLIIKDFPSFSNKNVQDRQVFSIKQEFCLINVHFFEAMFHTEKLYN